MGTPRGLVAFLVCLCFFSSSCSVFGQEPEVPPRLIGPPELAELPTLSPQTPSGHCALPWSLDLLIGLETGLRAQRSLALDGQSPWKAEVFVGLSAAAFPTAGIGVRRDFTLAQAESDSFVVAPGLGAYILGNPFSHGDGYFSGSGPSTIGIIVADVDFVWKHDFSKSFGVDLGLKIGVGVTTVQAAEVVPVVSIFTGVRF
jgi:hypothetical protein